MNALNILEKSKLEILIWNLKKNWRNGIFSVHAIVMHRPRYFESPKYLSKCIVTPMATSILLRHGQYKKNPKEMLTALGKKQARLAGKRLKEYSISEIYHSTMPRAKETAEIVRQIIGPKKRMQESDLLRECVPGFPKQERKKAGFTDEKMLRKSKRQAESAFKEFLAKNARSKKVILIVCHGNIIRYLICRTLGINTLNWVKMDINQCALSNVTYSTKRKKLEVISHNDVGHIPLRDQTFL